MHAGHLQVAVCAVVAITNLSQNSILKLSDVLGVPFLDSEKGSQAYVHKTLVEAQVEPSADVNLVRNYGATVDKHRDDFLFDVYESRVGQSLLSSLGIDFERALDLVHRVEQFIDPRLEVGRDRSCVVIRGPIDLDVFYPTGAWNQGSIFFVTGCFVNQLSLEGAHLNASW